MEVEVFAEGVDGHDDPWEAFGKSERGAHEFQEAFMRDAAEVLEQISVVPEVVDKCCCGDASFKKKRQLQSACRGNIQPCVGGVR